MAAHWKGAPVESGRDYKRSLRCEAYGGGRYTLTMQNSASPTVAELGIEWCVSAYLILDAPAVAMAYMRSCERGVFEGLFVRSLELPCIVWLDLVVRRAWHHEWNEESWQK
jgi:hypothetical protein